MKIGLSLSGINATLKNLQSAGVVVQSNFNESLVESGKQLRDRAKEILEGKVNPMYSTGRLRDSINMNIGEETGAWSGQQSLNISVGPDMRIAPYAEWVEFGHYMVSGWASKGSGGGSWWEGHHYMEGAWTEISPTIPKQISDTINLSLNNFARSVQRTRHKTTGKFVKGFGGVD